MWTARGRTEKCDPTECYTGYTYSVTYYLFNKKNVLTVNVWKGSNVATTDVLCDSICQNNMLRENHLPFIILQGTEVNDYKPIPCHYHWHEYL
jgi:hypothetical protein